MSRIVSVLILMFSTFLYGEEIELRVLTFNIWYGGEQVSFAQTVEVVKAARADLIGIQEPDGNLRMLANASGYSYVDEKRNIISRYPLFDPDTANQQYPYTWVLVRPGFIVAFSNVHLPSTPFGPDLIRDGKNAEEVIQTENELRVVELRPYVQALSGLAQKGIPVFFAGDFNSPSHQDWKAATTAMRQSVKFPLEWPVTKMLADAGLRDSFREIYPDAAKKPGLTYTPGYPHPWVKSNETLERIDMIWSGGKSKPLESKIIGETGNPAVDIAIHPYPSDHRAVVSTFRVTPAAAPPLIAVDTPVVEEGSDFLVRFQTSNFDDWGVLIVPHGGDAREPILSAKGPNLLSTRPTFKFGSLGIPPGKYDAVLINAAQTELARTTFNIHKKDAPAELRLNQSTFQAGETIEVSWLNAPGMKNDWIGIYRAHDPDVYGGYIAFIYTGARVEGAARFDSKVLSKPLPAGEYELRLMREDSYVMLASVKFSITN